MFNFFEELAKPDERAERRRLELIKQIKNNMDREHEREERYYRYAMNDLNNFNRYVQSLPNDCPQKSSLNYNLENIYEIHNNNRVKQNELYYGMRENVEKEIRNITYNLNNGKVSNRKTLAKMLIKQTISTLLGFVPILSNAKGMIDAIIGVDLITDEKLDEINRFYAGVSSLPIIGDIISWENWVTKILNKLFKL